MALSLASIRKETAIRAPRIILLGVEKIGKTTFACGSRIEDGYVVETGLNNPILIPIRGEEGADSIGAPMFPTCGSVDELLEALGALYTEEHEYSTVVIDSASALEPLVWADVCESHKVQSIEDVGGGYGKGYTATLGVWQKIRDGLDALRNERGMASIIIGHAKVKRFDDPAGGSYDQYQFDIHDKAANLLARWADVILFANTKVAVLKEDVGFKKEKKRGIDATGGQRFLFTQKRPAHPGGGRGAYGLLPYELPLDWSAFSDAVASATTIKTEEQNNG